PFPSPLHPTFALCMLPPRPPSTRFPYTTLFRSQRGALALALDDGVHLPAGLLHHLLDVGGVDAAVGDELLQSHPGHLPADGLKRSEEHTSELQSRFDLVCRLLLEKKKRKAPNAT